MAAGNRTAARNPKARGTCRRRGIRRRARHQHSSKNGSGSAARTRRSNCGHGCDESGVPQPSRHASDGEVEEGAAAELPVPVSLSREGRAGGARRRRPPRRGREEGEGGHSAGLFAYKPFSFSGFSNSSLSTLISGLRVLFSVSGGAFSQNRHRRVVWAVGSPTDDRDRCTVVL